MTQPHNLTTRGAETMARKHPLKAEDLKDWQKLGKVRKADWEPMQACTKRARDLQATINRLTSELASERENMQSLWVRIALREKWPTNVALNRAGLRLVMYFEPQDGHKPGDVVAEPDEWRIERQRNEEQPALPNYRASSTSTQ